MTKKIFRACFTVAAAVLLASMLIIFGILYDYFAGVQDRQLDAQLDLAASGVEVGGIKYFDGLKKGGCRFTWVRADGAVIRDTEVSEGEMVVVDLSSGSPAITVCRQYTHLRNVPVETAFDEERIADPLMAKGTEKIITPGVPGLVTETYLDTYVMGKLEKTELVSTTADNSVTQVVEYGTLVDSVSQDDTLVSVHRNDDGSGYLTFASGDTMAFSSQVTCNASAYAIHGHRAAHSLRKHRCGPLGVPLWDPVLYLYR